MDTLSRRHFLTRSSTVALGFAGLQTSVASGALHQLLKDGLGASRGAQGFGPLTKDPDGILDLPRGFTYKIISPMGREMADGLICPGKHDAMAAFPYLRPDGSADPDRCVIVRNHEIEDAHKSPSAFGARGELLPTFDQSKLYDPGHGRPSRGGCTSVVFNTKTQRDEATWLSLAGTERNCAGGLTPWGTWISCEETATTKGARFEKDHGYCFEVPVTTSPELADPEPIVGMGRFMHEAVCVDPETGIVYLTEDRGDGLLYRFVPDTKPTKPGDLHKPGKLQALFVLGRQSLDTRNWDEQKVKVGDTLKVGWVTLDDIESPRDDLRARGFRAGAARFARGEGMWWGGAGKDAAYFACTNGGSKYAGQIWRLTPSHTPGTPDTLELFIEPNDTSVLEMADNITFSPWNDMFVCEDGESPQYLVGVRPDGSLYPFARNAYNGSEFAGICFTPDASSPESMTMLVNIQNMGWTLAIRGPWDRRG